MIKFLVFLILLPILIAPVGVPILGYVGLNRIRHSRGRLYGLGMALFDLLFFPLLALDALIGWCWYAALTGRLYPKTWEEIASAGIVLVLTVVTSAVVDFLIVRAVWRAVSRPVGDTPQRKPTVSAPPLPPIAPPAQKTPANSHTAIGYLGLALVLVSFFAITTILSLGAEYPWLNREAPATGASVACIIGCIFGAIGRKTLPGKITLGLGGALLLFFLSLFLTPGDEPPYSYVLDMSSAEPGTDQGVKEPPHVLRQSKVVEKVALPPTAAEAAAAAVVKVSIDFGSSAEAADASVGVVAQRELLSLPGLAAMNCISNAQGTEIYVQGKPGIPAAALAAAVDARLAEVAKEFPAAAEIGKAEAIPGQQLPPLPQVRQVETVEVNLNRDKLHALGISISEFNEAIGKANKAGQKLADVVIESPQGQKVPLREIAELKPGQKPSHVIRHWSEKPEPIAGSAGPPQRLLAFGPKDKPISALARWTDNELEVAAGGADTIRLFEAPLAKQEQAILTWRVKIKTKDVTGGVYLEMWCRIPGAGEFFSRGLNQELRGTNDWVTCEVPFLLKKGQRADLLKLNLVFRGAGTVRVKEIELWATPLADSSEIAADSPTATNTNRFHSPTAGFTVIKPAAWHFASMEQVAAHRAVARLKDKELEKQIRQRANAPLVVVLKHPEPYDDLNPSTQVIVRPLGQLEGKTAVELMRFVVPTIQRAMADFTFVEHVQETKVDEMPAAYMKAKYTVANPASREFKTLSRMWIIPRGAFMFIISMSGPQEGPDVSETEFKAILDSIKIDK